MPETEEIEKGTGNYRKSYFAIISGLCASFASYFGKLSGGFEQERTNIWIVRWICITAMLICNSLVWVFFVKALHWKGGTLRATVMSAATNYVVSFIIGAYLFSEKIGMNSLMGTSLILIGLMFIVKGDKEDDTKKIK